MKAKDKPRDLIAALSRRSYKARLVPISSLPALQRTFAARLKSAENVIHSCYHPLNDT